MDNLDTKAAIEALETYLRSLPKPPLARPKWAYAEAAPVACYTVRGRICYAFGLKEAQGPITGYVLDTVGNVAYPVRNGDLQGALCRVGVW